MSIAAPLVLRPSDESTLISMVRSSTVEVGLAQRAQIVLLATEGVPADGGRLADPVYRRRGRRQDPTVESW